jgi:hypothetical protein
VIQVDRDIPWRRQLTLKKFPWEHIQPGESFFIPDANARSVSQTGQRLGRRLQRVFRTGKWRQGPVSGVRVWRIE